MFQDAKNKSTDRFNGYCNSLITKAESSGLLLKEYGIDIDVSPSPIGRVAYVTILDCCRIPDYDGQESKRLSFRQKGIIQRLLSTRNLRSWGLQDCTEITFTDEQEVVLCVWCPYALTFEESLAFDILEVDSIKHPNYWKKGCEASVFPDPYQLLSDLKCPKSMKSNGFNKPGTINDYGNEIGTVEEFTSIGPDTKTGHTNSIKYRSSDSGKETDSHPFSMTLPRKVYTCSTNPSTNLNKLMDDKPHLRSLYNKLMEIYKDKLPKFLRSRNCPQEHLENEVSRTIAPNEMFLAANRLTAKHNMGQHTDPPVPSPALAAGSTNFVPDYEKRTWSRKQKGGNLYLADSMICLDYHPQDVVLFDGNMLHGVTAIGGEANNSLSRFSIVLFSRHRKDGSGIRDYGKYDGSYDNVRMSSRINKSS